MSHILVVAKRHDDVFAALFFDGLPPELRRHIRIREFGHDALAAEVAGAAAIIVMRHGLFSFGALASVAARARVPSYYFLDDNLLLLRQEPETYGPFWSAYTEDNVRVALRGFEGVLLASAPLVAYFRDHALHPRLIEYAPIAWPVLRERTQWSRDAATPFRIAFFGGEHRRELFLSLVHPAAMQLSREHPVELVVFGIDRAAIPASRTPSLDVIHAPYEVRYSAALDALAGRQIDVVAHPTPPSANNPYRNANVLINARSAGAVAVVSNAPPYDTLGSPSPALLCDNVVEQWTTALRRLASDAALCAETYRHADEFCRRHFNGASNAATIERVLGAHPAPRAVTRAMRLAVAGPSLVADRALFQAKAVVRGWLGRD